ncbi:4'-phosphopantetheinyl transferase family protein [Polaribacter sp.]|uniref:4'-phosphopantetheinyl transferase family protein n=1 Tax=Polaribacter sp. TaxID=1920175 RepID=UPI003F6BE90D
MLRIGNDVVDLNLAKTQSNWQRRGFLEKLFTKEEQKEILYAKNSFLKVWLFWSMKEAAYKCYTQQFQERFFSPLKFSCKTEKISSGIVTIGLRKYHVKYIITNNYIHSVAQERLSNIMVENLFLIANKKHLSKIINHKILFHFDDDVQLKKNTIGIPLLYHNNKVLPISISISHHGKYGAFVFSY